MQATWRQGSWRRVRVCDLPHTPQGPTSGSGSGLQVQARKRPHLLEYLSAHVDRLINLHPLPSSSTIQNSHISPCARVASKVMHEPRMHEPEDHLPIGSAAQRAVAVMLGSRREARRSNCERSCDLTTCSSSPSPTPSPSPSVLSPQQHPPHCLRDVS